MNSKVEFVACRLHGSDADAEGLGGCRPGDGRGLGYAENTPKLFTYSSNDIYNIIVAFAFDLTCWRKGTFQKIRIKYFLRYPRPTSALTCLR